MASLEAKITISAIDHVSAVTKTITKSLAGIKNATAGLKSSWQNLSVATSDITSRLQNFSIVAIATGTGIFSLVEHYAEFSHQLILSSQRTGVAVDSLQKLQYAAKLSGIGTDELNNSLKFLNQSIVIGATNPTSQQAAAFNQMQINVRNANGSLKTADQVMGELADKFQKTTSAQYKTTTAMALFRKQGALLIPFLNKGSAHIQDLGKELESLGHVWSSDELKKGQDFEESYIKLKTAISGVSSVIAINLIPVIQPVVDTMKNWIAANKVWLADNIKQDVVALGAGLKQLWQSLKNVKDYLMPVVDALGGFKAVIGIIAGIYVAKLVISFGSLIGALASVVKSFTIFSFAILANPITWFIGTIVVLGVAAYELIAHWDKVKIFFTNLWTSITPYIEAFLNIITLGAYNTTKDIISYWGSLNPAFKGIWGEITADFKSYGNAIYNYWAGTIDGIKNLFKSGIDFVLNLFGTNLSAISKKIGGFIFDITSPMKDSIGWIEGKFTSLSKFLGGISYKIVQIKNAITGTSTTMSDAAQTNSINPAALKNSNFQAGSSIAALVANKKQASPVNPQNPSSNSLQSALQTQNIYNSLSPNQSSKIDINLQIDSNGRPTKVTTKAPANIDFTLNTGRII